MGTQPECRARSRHHTRLALSGLRLLRHAEPLGNVEAEAAGEDAPVELAVLAPAAVARHAGALRHNELGERRLHGGAAGAQSSERLEARTNLGAQSPPALPDAERRAGPGGRKRIMRHIGKNAKSTADTTSPLRPCGDREPNASMPATCFRGHARFATNGLYLAPGKKGRCLLSAPMAAAV